MKKSLLLVLPLLCALSSCGNVTQPVSNPEEDNKTVYENYKPVTFNESNIILRAPIISDEHCERTDPIDSSAVVTQSLKNFTSLVGRSAFDIWLSGGDRSLTGTLAADDAWASALSAGCSDSVGKMFFVHGNHDVHWTGCATKAEHYNYLSTKYGMYNGDANDGQPEAGNRHRIVNGIHFLTIANQSINGTDNPIGDANTTWLRARLNAIKASDPNKPVFLLAHVTAPNTVTGSGDEQYDGYWGSSPSLHNICKDYPNVVLMSGHIHYDCHSERNIWQGSYTAIGLPTLAGGDGENHWFNGLRDSTKTTTINNGQNANYDLSSHMYETSQCMYLEVDNNYNSRITRYDLVGKKQIGKKWVIPAPKSDKSHLIPYSKSYKAATNTAPTISDAEGNFIVNCHATGVIDATWKQFEDNDQVYAYELQLFTSANRFSLTPKSTPTEKFLILNPVWRTTTINDFAYTFTTNVSRGDTFIVRLIAFDDYNAYTIKLPTTMFYLP